MKRTIRFVLSLLVAFPAIAGANADPPPQIPLWNGGQRPFNPGASCATGDLPIGPGAAQGHWWKQTLVDWLHLVSAQRVTLANPAPDTDSPWNQWGFSSNPGVCISDFMQAGGSQPQRSTIESLYLNASGDQWVGDALCRMNADETHFLWANLANRSDCRVHVPSILMDPGLSSWAHIPFSGNPYSQSPAHDPLLTRGAVWLVMHLVIADYLWWTNTAGTVVGRFPCDRSQCVQPAASLSASGRVLPGPIHMQPPVSYNDYDGLPISHFAGNFAMHVFDEAGALLAHYAEAYKNVKSILGTNEQKAVEEAILTFAERVHSMSRWTDMANMPHRNVVALYVAAEVQSDSMARGYLMWLYHDLRDYFYDPTNGYAHAQGTFKQLTGFDTGYHRDDMLNLARLSWVERSQPSAGLAAAANAAFDLWGHLVLPDLKGTGNVPQVQLVSPTAFNSRTGNGMAEAIGSMTSQRFLLGGGAGLPWSWAEMAHFTYPWTAYDAYHQTWLGGPTDPWADMACDWLSFLGNSVRASFHHRFGGTGGYPTILDNTPPRFPDPEVGGYVSRFYEQPNFAFLYGDHSLFTAWDVAAHDPAAVQMPYELPVPYHHDINHAFFYARTPAATPAQEMIAVVHAGFVGTGDNDGFGGGQLAALWSPTAGVTSLIRRRGHNYDDPAANDDMTQWREMPMHAVSMVNPTNRWTSSSRIARPTVFEHYWPDLAPSPADAFALFALHDGKSIELRGCEPPTIPQGDAEKAPVGLMAGTTGRMIRVCGDIPTTAFGQQALSRPIPYQRDFLLSEGVVSVETRLRPLVADPLSEAYETIPLHYGNAGEHPPGDFVVTLFTNNGTITWTPGMAAPSWPLVTRVRVTRFGGAMTINLPTARRMSISPSWQGLHGNSWNLLIDLLAGQPALGSTTVRYQITVD